MNSPRLSRYPQIEQETVPTTNKSCFDFANQSTLYKKKISNQEQQANKEIKNEEERIYSTGSEYLPGILREGGSQPYVPIQDLRGAGQGRTYTRINAPGEIPLSASGDKYYKLGWLLSFPSLSPPCRLHETPPSPHPRSLFFVHSSFSRSIHPLLSKPSPFSSRSPCLAYFLCSLTKPPPARRTPLSQRIYIVVLRSPSPTPLRLVSFF